jgi:hypothetical protein
MPDRSHFLLKPLHVEWLNPGAFGVLTVLYLVKLHFFCPCNDPATFLEQDGEVAVITPKLIPAERGNEWKDLT